jgi:hypothetical protein
MAYMDNKAAGRNKQTDTVEDLKASSKTGSNQEKNQSVQKKSLTPSVRPDAGNVVKVQGNTKNSAVLKDPLSRYAKKVLPATVNPDGGRDRSGKKSAN